MLNDLQEQHIASAIEYIARSHQQIAHILEAKRDIVVHLANLVTSLADTNLSFSTKDHMVKSCTSMTENVVSYLNSIGELEEAIAENLGLVMKEVNVVNEQNE